MHEKKQKTKSVPVRFAASAIKKVVQDSKKNKAVSSNGKSEILVSFVTCTIKLMESRMTIKESDNKVLL